jgi:hypothetical protein
VRHQLANALGKTRAELERERSAHWAARQRIEWWEKQRQVLDRALQNLIDGLKLASAP